ncbi:LSU ribosomal protein L14p (L23e) [Caballeronia sordidicola]|uniref:LSU ribosomal protein L14p (L23e) n=1 Tax=Caballeronia sordidicola TaxID=196367 RepID=A0A242M9B2_CABSO|nr:LSU ribosomal protein L14p (L23e) [Caballeronia sordidicola]OTP79727.1 LSU ribosomal protein L14p (L23e) [Caballeronia sordidicola]
MRHGGVTGLSWER